MIAIAECTSMTVPSAIICCSLGVAGVGGLTAMCTPDAKRMMKGILANDSMIMTSEQVKGRWVILGSTEVSSLYTVGYEPQVRE